MQIDKIMKQNSKGYYVNRFKDKWHKKLLDDSYYELGFPDLLRELCSLSSMPKEWAVKMNLYESGYLIIDSDSPEADEKLKELGLKGNTMEFYNDKVSYKYHQVWEIDRDFCFRTDKGNLTNRMLCNGIDFKTTGVPLKQNDIYVKNVSNDLYPSFLPRDTINALVSQFSKVKNKANTSNTCSQGEGDRDSIGGMSLSEPIKIRTWEEATLESIVWENGKIKDGRKRYILVQMQRDHKATELKDDYGYLNNLFHEPLSNEELYRIQAKKKKDLHKHIPYSGNQGRKGNKARTEAKIRKSTIRGWCIGIALKKGKSKTEIAKELGITIRQVHRLCAKCKSK